MKNAQILNNTGSKGEITRESRKQLDLSENQNTTYQTMWLQLKEGLKCKLSCKDILENKKCLK